MNHSKACLVLTTIFLSILITPPVNAINSLATSDNKNADSSLLLSAQQLNQRGIEYLSSGKPKLALETWQQANKIYNQLKDKEGLIGTEINQAQAFQSLGFYRQSLLVLQSVKTKLEKEPSSILKAKALMSLGNTLKSLRVLTRKNNGDSQEVNLSAEDVLNEALQNALDTNDLLLASQIKLSLANTLELMNFKDKSIQKYEEIIESINTTPLLRIQAQVNLYRLELEKNVSLNTLAFVTNFKKDLALIPPSRSTIYANVNLAKIIQKDKKDGFENQELLTAVSELLRTAISQSRIIKDVRGEAQAVGALGDLYHNIGQNQNAQKLTEQALVLAESLPAPDIAYRLQWQLGRILNTPNSKNPNLAIAAYRQSISHLKTLRNDLNSSDADLQFSFRDSVEPVYRELVDLLLKDEDKVLITNIGAARDLIESLQVAEVENFLRQGCLDTYTVQLDKIDRSAAIIYPIVLPDRIAVITSIPQQPLRYHSKPIPTNEVASTVNKLRGIIEETRGGKLFDSKKEQEFQENSKLIYDSLILPIESSLQQSNIKNLVFILDGSLRNMPMSTLYNGKNYLIEKYNLALTPGLQLVPPQNSLGNKQYQAFLGGVSESRFDLDSIPTVREELESIAKLIPNQKLLDAQFSQSQATSNINSNSASIVHIATHGNFDSNPDKTYILTWDKLLNLNQFNDILQGRNNQIGKEIDLLVLSACQTAAGDDRATLGLAGVAVRARTKSTIASLWNVSDISTNILMKNFYHNLIVKKLGKAESLRLAQQSLLNDPLYRSPFHWAPFVLVGNWQ
jgi:CHAT domain-containing protein